MSSSVLPIKLENLPEFFINPILWSLEREREELQPIRPIIGVHVKSFGHCTVGVGQLQSNYAGFILRNNSVWVDELLQSINAAPVQRSCASSHWDITLQSSFKLVSPSHKRQVYSMLYQATIKWNLFLFS